MKLLAVLALLVLSHAKPLPKDGSKPKPKPKDSRLVEQEQSQSLHTDETDGLCSSDNDCDNGQYCDSAYGTCSDDIHACYDSDECRGTQICDMSTYTCVDPPTTTSVPIYGCCAGDSQSASEKCVEFVSDPEKCDSRTSCRWIEGRTADCSFTAPGCCRGDSYKANGMCLVPTDEAQCTSKGCEWVETEDPNDCVITTTTTVTPTTTTPIPGCCQGDSYKANDKCLGAIEQDMCEKKGCAWLETDDPNDCVLTTTSTPTTTPSPTEFGCCAGDSKVENARCNEKDGQDMCDRSSSCHWRSGAEVTCEWEATTTITPGCCFVNPESAYNAKWQETCTGYYTERDCAADRKEGVARCAWEDLSEGYDCSLLWPTTTSTPTLPAGCCHGGSYKANDKCAMAMTADKCAAKDCTWLLTDEPNDCVITTTDSPSTTEDIGCCKADNIKHQGLCDMKTTHKKCDRSSSCHWLSGDVEGLCEWEETSTVTPGCCFINPEVEFSRKYHGACIGFFAERECLTMLNDEGEFTCAWDDVVEGYDCENLWPTTTTTTEAPGCCYADTYKANNKCLQSGQQDQCESRGCHWLETEHPEDCELTTTKTPTTTAEPGCCKGTSYLSNDLCNLGLDEKSCGRKCEWISGGDLDIDCVITTTRTPTTTEEIGCCKGSDPKTDSMCNPKTDSSSCERSNSCTWIKDGVLGSGICTSETFDEPGCCYGDTAKTHPMCLEKEDDKEGCERSGKCVFREGEDAVCDLPTTTSTPTEPAGCCHGGSYKANDKCAMAMTADKCASKDCTWLLTDDPEDCVITTTDSPTTTSSAPGCCYGDSYKANDKCLNAIEQDMCEKKGCAWLETTDPSDCVVTTTSTSTPTEEIGCCKGDSFKSNEKCNMKVSSDKCSRSSSCHWIVDGDIEDECVFGTTESPEDPGCCYGNPDAAYSQRWMDTCTGYFSERECLMLTGDEGDLRCFWEAKSANYDCSMLWPTTTSTPTEPAGCCMGDSYKANSKCVMAMEAGKCTDKGCLWILTDNIKDCEITTTETPTTTAEIGCCYGEGEKENEMCGNKIGHSQCNNNDACEFRVGEDADCTWTPTTTTTGVHEVGCCVIRGSDLSSRWLEECGGIPNKSDCLMPIDVDHNHRCEWVVKESGFDVSECETEWPTTTSEPWLGAKVESEQVMAVVDGGSVMSVVTQTSVSLSSVVLCAVVAVAMYALYAWWAHGMKKGVEMRETRQMNYHSM